MHAQRRNAIVIINLVLSSILIFDALNVGDALLRFIAAGHIPGTTVYIDASVMLALFMAGLGFLAGRLTVRLARAIQRRVMSTSRRQLA